MRNERAGVHSSAASLPDDLFQSPVSARHLSECTVPVVWEILVNLSIVLGGPRGWNLGVCENRCGPSN